MEFYTYVYFIDGVPEYVGKGKSKRKYLHENANTVFGHHLAKAIREQRRVCLLTYTSQDEQTALEKERELIAEFGRRVLGEGSLYNLTSGGQGTSGYKLSDETKAKISAANSGKKPTEETRAKLRAARARQPTRVGKKGYKHTEETKAKISAAKKGKTHSEEHKSKISAAKKGCNQNRIGTKHSLTTRAKISASKIGKKTGPRSIAECQQISLRQMKPCTIDGVCIFPSRKDLIRTLGSGVKGLRNPNFRFVTRSPD